MNRINMFRIKKAIENGYLKKFRLFGDSVG